MDLSILSNWMSPFVIQWVSGLLFYFDAASDLGLHCLPMCKNGTLGLYGLKAFSRCFDKARQFDSNEYPIHVFLWNRIE